MIRILLAAFIMLALPGVAPGQTAPAPAAATPAVSAAQTQQALDVLKDPARRAQLIGVLEAIAKANAATPAAAPSAVPATPAAPASTAPAPTPPAEPAAEASPLQLAPDSLGAQLISDASRRLGQLSDDLLVTVRTVTDFPLLLNFVEQLINDPWSRGLLLTTAWRLALVLGGGLAAQWAVRRLLSRPMAALAGRAEAHEPDPAVEGIVQAEAGQTERLGAAWPSPLGMLRRVPLSMVRLFLLLLPILALIATGYVLLGTSLGSDPIARLVILGIMDAYALCRVVTSVLRALCGPGRPCVLPLSDEAADYTLRWTRRMAAVGIFGYTLAEVGLLFGLYRIAHDALLKLVVLVIYVMLATMILQNRAWVASLIRARPDAVGPLAAVRNRLAGLWHFAAMFYLLALWMVWALAVPDGFSRLLRIVVLTAIVIVGARQVAVLGLAAAARWTRLPPALGDSLPGLDQRMGNYHPILRGVVQVVVWGVALVLVLEAWSIDAFSWFTSGHVGARLLGALGTIGVTLIASLVVWEAVNISIQRHLSRLAREAQLARSARLRTLLPMLRTALMISICMVAGLMILSEIGVNIAPLLAGAGVIGIAVGFGSQKLVQDVITGLFLLLENTMQVGDAVTLGGLSGSVEALSVRTIRLRSVDGSVHIIPFSAVTTVTNMTRDFGYAVIEVPAGLNEVPDHIIEILLDIASGMRDEFKWKDVIREDLEIFGVDKFIANAFVITGRMRTTAGGRWGVRREFMRRVKERFDAQAIDSPLTSFIALNRAPPTMIVQDPGG